MASVGKRLRLLRESRNTTIDEMARATGIGQSYLEALERDAVHELPGKAFGKLYIRAYAEVFTFDPRPWIDDYDREQRTVSGAAIEPAAPAPAGSRPVAAAIAQWKAARAAAERPEPVREDETPEEDPPAPDVAASEPETSAPRPNRRVVPFVLAGVAVIAAGLYFFGTRSGPPPAPPVPQSRPAQTAPPEPQAPEPPPPAPVAAPKEPPSQAAPLVRAEPAGALTVTEWGVGRRIVNLKLEGESDRFDQGGRVCFSTRVLGGKRGDVIRHAWLHEGRLEQTITLRLGGADWRTHSNKTLGHAGAWAVEARDARGAVLTRVEFVCVP